MITTAPSVRAASCSRILSDPQPDKNRDPVPLRHGIFYSHILFAFPRSIAISCGAAYFLCSLSICRHKIKKNSCIFNNFFLTWGKKYGIHNTGDGRHPSVRSAPKPGKQATVTCGPTVGIVDGTLNGQRANQSRLALKPVIESSLYSPSGKTGCFLFIDGSIVRWND